MGIWTIVIIILVIITVLAFASAVCVAYDAWRKEKRINWEILLEGLFFIPLCLFLAVLWPIHKLRMYIKEKKREKQFEESKKYHFQKFGFRLKGLPFKPSSDEIIFVENEYDERLNQILQRNLDYIKECFDNNKYVHPHFIYLPNLVNDLSQDVRSFSYMMPYVKDVNISTSISLKSSDLLDYLLVPENRSKIKPCFARYRGEEHGNYLFECVGFEPDEDIDEKKFIRALCSAFDYYPMSVGPVYQESMLREGADADDKFENEYRQLIEEVEERILQLRKMGISQWALEQMVKPELKLSRLIITKDYRILLPDYNNIEIKMEPLIKAVYLLFLNHPEGILFKHLPDYRKELAQIYEKLKPYGMSDKVFQSIEDVTNPLLNSINEKCARIRGAFVSRFDESLACNYYIYGLRGKAKKISLPRDLIIWE